MRVLFIGDIVGRPGLRIVQRAVPKLRTERGLDAVVANAENVSGGSGCNPTDYRKLREVVDLVTMGDHIYRKFEIAKILETDERICKPANFPPESPGREFAIMTMANGERLAVVSLMGRTYMRSVDCPFHAADRVLKELQGKADAVIIDVHAEATADKYQLGHYLNGRVAAVIGTHTHVPTADEQIFNSGTAFLCDAGMTGPHDSILGRDIESVINHSLDFTPSPFDVAEGDVRLNGAIVEVAAGKALSIERVCVRE